MYQVNIGDKVLYYPASNDYAIYNTNLNEEIGLAGEFSFKVPPTNPYYDQLTQGAMITILDNGEEMWRGEIKEIKVDFAKIADVYCVEDLGLLGYEFAPPESTKSKTYIKCFQDAIDYYNANRPTEYQFTAGYITNVTDTNLCNWTTEHEWSILDSIRACICRDTGYLRVRRVTSGGTVTRYIDVVRLEDYGRVNNQPIEYSYNLLDYVKDSDYGNLVNVLTPYGAELDTELYEGYNERVEGDTITNADSVSVYGRHAKAVVFDNVTDVNALNALAASYLSRYSQPQLKMEVKAVDLSQVENVDEIKIGDALHVIAKPFAVDQWLYLTQINRDLQNAGNNTITLSGHVRTGQTLTDQTTEIADAVKETRTTVLEASMKNALNMLLDETQGGNIVYEYHYTDGKPDYIVAINICDAPTIDASLSRWRWSYNGLGFLSRQSTSDPWPTSSIPIALTNDGAIVAERIGAGTISGCDFYWEGEYIDPQTQEDRTATGHLYFDNPFGDIPTVNLESTAHLDLEAAFSMLLKARDGINITASRGGVSLNAGENGVCLSEGYRIAGTINDQKLEFYFGESGGYKFLYVYSDGVQKGYVQLS